MSSSKSAPASTCASSKNGVAPRASISLAICFATHVSRPQWLTKTNRFVVLEDSSALYQQCPPDRHGIHKLIDYQSLTGKPNQNVYLRFSESQKNELYFWGGFY